MCCLNGFFKCRPGFRGYNCSLICPENYYGRRCQRKCQCHNSEYCHHVCGCVSNLLESFGNATMVHNVTENEIDTSVTNQTLFTEQCLSSAEKTTKIVVTTAGNDIEDSTTKYDEEYEILRTVFLVVLPFVIFVCLLLCFGIIYRKCNSKKKQEMKGLTIMVIDGL
ncbi:multiple epidermal growth factor-like domains protein 10 [Saccostrea echinata]|uniref:multiple epidermal growth factor-like domains protein 10 n=1 Tax=Saccostrea echinata TaxID=191078 RepID=UPI002A83C2BA|nr:multiple epidermal growth factor-like domains protein 10 [Saccostrea echinata]